MKSCVDCGQKHDGFYELCENCINENEQEDSSMLTVKSKEENCIHGHSDCSLCGFGIYKPAEERDN